MHKIKVHTPKNKNDINIHDKYRLHLHPRHHLHRLENQLFSMHLLVYIHPYPSRTPTIRNTKIIIFRKHTIFQKASTYVMHPQSCKNIQLRLYMYNFIYV